MKYFEGFFIFCSILGIFISTSAVETIVPPSVEFAQESLVRSHNEGETISFIVKRVGDVTSAVSFSYSATQLSPAPETVIKDRISANIPANEASVTIQFSTIVDNVATGDYQLKLELNENVSPNYKPGLISIIDADYALMIKDQESTSVDEGETYPLKIHRLGNTDKLVTAQIDVATKVGRDNACTTPGPTTVTWNVGESDAIVNLEFEDDKLIGDITVVTVTLSNNAFLHPDSKYHSTDITVDEITQAVGFKISSHTLIEGTLTYNVEFDKYGDQRAPLSGKFSLSKSNNIPITSSDENDQQEFTIAANEASGTAVLTFDDDEAYNPGMSVVLEILSSENYLLESGKTTMTVDMTETDAMIGFKISSVSITEGTDADYVVEFEKFGTMATPITAQFSIKKLVNAPCNEDGPISVTIPTNQQFTSSTLTFGDDLNYNEDMKVVLELIDTEDVILESGKESMEIGIVEDDTALSFNDIHIIGNEGETIMIVIDRVGPVGTALEADVTVQYTGGYTGSLFSGKHITFDATKTMDLFALELEEDDHYTGDGIVTLTLVPTVGGIEPAMSVAVVTATDQQAALAFETTSIELDEGTTSLEVTVNKIGHEVFTASGSITISNSGSIDVCTTTGPIPVNLPANVEKDTFTINFIAEGDDVIYDDVKCTLSLVGDDVITDKKDYIIDFIDNDGRIGFESSEITILETEITLDVTLFKTGPLRNAVTAEIEISNSPEASSCIDEGPISITIPAGETKKIQTFNFLNDSEYNEGIMTNFTLSGDRIVDENSVYYVTIVEDDPVPSDDFPFAIAGGGALLMILIIGIIWVFVSKMKKKKGASTIATNTPMHSSTQQPSAPILNPTGDVSNNVADSSNAAIV